ncbi:MULTISPECIES: hypothetical protein [Halocynthiibacter]|uniref:Uncharacterized protein n=1 Tax=Halocynthiibacter halioticoli TaxID=2986804 RepID=A0AAE3IZ92_9RHOB|nr:MULTISPECIES: hypothetical protein [Halocynthiibacter]MCV6825067.1 hypothetical protein [Halocynthiibacter halioticoli]MCW4058068.1 hypothetical protein [Halocynthiibacter sp. SDUM655004]
MNAVQAFAHAPYYTQVEKLELQDGEIVSLKLLHGDGIIAGDPVRAIVVDSDLRVRAVSPLALKLHIFCEQQDGIRRCRVYDTVTAAVYRLDPSSWALGPVIEELGKPLRTAYPEDMGQNFGFAQRPATLLEIIRFEGDKVISFPIMAGLSLIWWTLTALLYTPLAWRLYLNKGRLQPSNLSSVLLILLRLGGVAGFLSIALVGWAWEPYSIYYASFFALLGLIVALFLSRPKRNLPKSGHLVG